MNHIDRFLESQPATDALERLLGMAYEQDDYEGMVEISQGLQYCESVLEHLQQCYELEAA